jgi:hypothetical protein
MEWEKVQIASETEDERVGRNANLGVEGKTLMGMEKRWIRKNI